ncbi:MAG: ROK family transcriptional regulator [Microlunatus sp.]|nr:ROK family transcriptional regulator [Microlunatus sp.]
MTPAKPSLGLLRSLTDEHVLRALIAERRLTRAEIAARTGISKPTIGDSVRRLAEGGLVRDTGERTTGPGRIGTYYALAADLGAALVVGIAPEGVVAEVVDVYGDVVAREAEPVERPARPAQVARTLRSVATRVLSGGPGRIRLAVVSAADPVDRGSGRLVHLPDAPFLVGELSAVDVLAPVVAGPVTVDNDVNWAARAERADADPGTLDDFGYLYLGEGLGCAVVADGEVRRGHGGLSGEISQVITTGPAGRAVRFTQVFEELGLHRPGSTAIDADALLRAVGDHDDHGSPGILDALAEAIAGVLAALIALTDPRLVILGGTWGPDPAVLRAATQALARQPRSVPLQVAKIIDEPALAGARQRGVHDLRALLTQGAPA